MMKPTYLWNFNNFPGVGQLDLSGLWGILVQSMMTAADHQSHFSGFATNQPSNFQP
jgi:hypothetical protein